MKSVTSVSQSSAPRANNYSYTRGSFIRFTHCRIRYTWHSVFSRETNVKRRPDLTRSFRSSPPADRSCPLFELSLELSVPLYVDLPTWSIYCSWVYKAPLRPIARIVRRNEIACCRDRVPSSVDCAQQCLIKYEISFTGGKALTEASKSIRSWQINAARDISFSRVLTA